MRRASIALGLLAAAGGAAGVWWWSTDGRQGGDESSGRPPPAVEVAPATSRELSVRVSATGTAQAPEEVVITAETSGRVEEILFEEGARVEKDALLVRLEDVRQRAEVARAQAALAEAERELRRLQALDGERYVSESDLDAARTAAARAQAGLDIARDALADRQLRAPFTGELSRRLVSPGALLDAGDAVVQLTRTRPLELVFSVPGRHAGALAPGMAVRATTEAIPDRVFSATVDFVDPRVDPGTRTISLEATLANEDGALRAGQFMQVELLLERRDALTVPEEAVRLRGPVSFVFALDEQDRAHRRTVQTGVRRAGWVEIIAGLEPGERVVTRGAQAIREGQQVQVAAQGEEAQRPPQT